MLNFTVTKTFKFLAVNVKTSWRKRKDEVYIGDITFHHEKGLDISRTERKELLKYMKKHNTNVVTNGIKFFTCNETTLIPIEHPAFKVPDIPELV